MGPLRSFLLIFQITEKSRSRFFETKTETTVSLKIHPVVILSSTTDND